MVDECAKAGLSKPLIESNGRHVRVDFARLARMGQESEEASKFQEMASKGVLLPPRLLGA